MTKFYMDGDKLYFHNSLKSPSERQAIEWSVEKWDVLADHLETDGVIDIWQSTGRNTCALCVFADDDCGVCPVYKVTRRKACGGTPYKAFSDNPTAENARLEAAFLLRLLKGEMK